MNRSLYALALAFLSSAFLAGCAHGPSTKELSDPKYLVAQACEPGTSSQEVKGSIWMKAQSKDASGQFPANVTAKAPDNLTLEVVNLLGGTQAIITVEGKKYTILVPDKNGKNRKREGQGSWGGIPLNWASDLFLGKIPCPSRESLVSARLSVSPDHDLIVEVPASGAASAGGEKFVYSFRSWGGKAWPERLHWEHAGTQATVDFKFDDPEDKTHSPRKWEAKSAQGEVKVRWRDREATP
jgi:hypothetical protein